MVHISQTIQSPNAFYKWSPEDDPLGRNMLWRINVILTYIFYVLIFNFNKICCVDGKADILL
jgi:hypothetical protein